jgi:hypothetical protein
VVEDGQQPLRDLEIAHGRRRLADPRKLTTTSDSSP